MRAPTNTDFHYLWILMRAGAGWCLLVARATKHLHEHLPANTVKCYLFKEQSDCLTLKMLDVHKKVEWYKKGGCDKKGLVGRVGKSMRRAYLNY